MKKICFLLGFFLSGICSAQDYNASIDNFRKDYIDKHEVVKSSEKKYLAFFPINNEFKVAATFEKANNAPWFKMETSGMAKPLYRAYGKLTFTLAGKKHQLTVYQSQSLMSIAAFKDYLFIPFTDASSGEETYIGGRYIDLKENAFSGDTVLLDFNRAYNPYCAYVSGVYNCPIPPAENRLPISITAGEKAFAKPH